MPLAPSSIDRDVGGGDALDHPRDLEHLGRAGDDAAEDVGARVRGAQAAVFRLEVVDVVGAADDHAELVDVDRLGVEIERAAGDRAQPAVARAVARGDDDLGPRLGGEDRLERREPLARPVGIGRQAEVERHHRRRVRLDRVERRACGRRR